MTSQQDDGNARDSEPAVDDLIARLRVVARGIAQTFAPFCEVVVHDLRTPDTSLVAIENPLSRRSVGAPATELGMARLADSAFPELLVNYPNKFADGRRVKSTSIGFKNDAGEYVAVLGINVDLTPFEDMGAMLDRFVRLDDQETVGESLDPVNSTALRRRIESFAAARATSPRALTTEQRRDLVRELREGGFLEVRRAVETIAAVVGVSRATIYADAK